MKLKILAVIVLAAVGVGAVVYVLGGATGGSARSTEYLTSAATTGDVTDDVAATGTLEAQARYGLVFGADPYLVTASSSAPTSSTTWPVKEVKVKVGDTVKKGDVIASADTADLQRQLATALNDLRAAKLGLTSAKGTLSDARTADVAAQIRQAEVGVFNAKNQVAQASQTVTDLRSQIKGGTITSPIDGLVTEVDVTAGFDAPTGPAAIVDAPGFQVTTDVVESDLTDVKVGQAATIDVSAVGSTIDGTVASISPVASTDSQSGVVSYPVTVTLTSPPTTVRSGMTADVTITIANAANVLTVPAEALRGSDGDYSVLVLDAQGQPQATPVQVGLVTNTLAEIKSGLAEGQEVVTGTSSSRTGTTSTTGGFVGGGVGIPGGGFGGGTFRNGNGGGTNRNGNGN